MADRRETRFRDPNRNYKWTRGPDVVTPEDELENGPPAFTPDELNNTSSLPKLRDDIEYDDNGNAVRKKPGK